MPPFVTSVKVELCYHIASRSLAELLICCACSSEIVFAVVKQARSDYASRLPLTLPYHPLSPTVVAYRGP